MSGADTPGRALARILNRPFGNQQIGLLMAFPLFLAHESSLRWWQGWADRSDCGHSPYCDAVRRSLLVLRALTHEDTGGIVAAACRRTSAACATGTTGTAGCATRR